MKAVVLSRDKLIKIRYNEDSELNRLMEALQTVPDLDVQDRGYRGDEKKMDGLKLNGVTLYLAHLPSRKGLAFCFDEGKGFYPVANVSEKLEPIAVAKWQKMLSGIESDNGGR